MNILLLAGTRPEAVKMAPVAAALAKSAFTPVLCSTGQHREILASALADFNLKPDLDLALMRDGQTLCGFGSRLLGSLEDAFAKVRPCALLVQGDTTTAFIGAMAAFYSGIPVGHVEAGLRSGNLAAPFPEEFHRRAASLAVRWHFAPTDRAAQNLLGEGAREKNIFVTGNTVVDALLHMRKSLAEAPLPEAVEGILAGKRPYVVVTAHRRENFGTGIRNISAALARLARETPECAFVYPVHPNPQAATPAREMLGGIANILLVPPFGYRQFLRLLENCVFAISDSGGVQEEAPSFGKKVLVLREVTERPEGVEAGFARLVGTDPELIFAAGKEMLENPSPPSSPNPYGDGRAAGRIAAILEKNLGLG